ncbi:hypothetical protein [Nocardia sp. NPDC052566]|uniref:hypothetical protein n=1 Tax=Nocardia sp. NPDC052566 TaxID=3364330 RepID=UPI0037CB4431
MNWPLGSHSQSLVAAALTAAVLRANDLAAIRTGLTTGCSGAAARIWVVWIRDRKILGCESVTGLDREVAATIPVEAEQAVVIAVAPSRVAGAVLTRVEVIGEYLHARGLPERAVDLVHVFALQEGAMWTCLRGGVGGVVPPLVEPSAARRRWFDFSHRAATARRSAVAVVAAIVMSTVVAVSGHADPDGQAGVTAPGLGTGQAGVTVEPVPPKLPSPAQGQSGGAVMIWMPEGPESSVEIRTPSWRSYPGYGDATGGSVAGIDEPLAVGEFRIARPNWLAPEIANRERGWCNYLLSKVATEADTAGLDPAGLGTPVAEILGDRKDSVPVPDEWAAITTALPAGDAPVLGATWAAIAPAYEQSVHDWLAQLAPTPAA